jgi:DNA-binding winged helix-turn-helix (wHTH) protein
MPRRSETRDVVTASFQLGEWLVDPILGRITHGDTTVRLEIKVMDVLVCLAANASNLVTRRQLRESVWGTETVSDNTLTHAITELRAALGDDARNPAYIETIHRRGYLLLAPVGDPDPERSEVRENRLRGTDAVRGSVGGSNAILRKEGWE